MHVHPHMQYKTTVSDGENKKISVTYMILYLYWLVTSYVSIVLYMCTQCTDLLSPVVVSLLYQTAGRKGYINQLHIITTVFC